MMMHKPAPDRIKLSQAAKLMWVKLSLSPDIPSPYRMTVE